MDGKVVALLLVLEVTVLQKVSENCKSTPVFACVKATRQDQV